MLAYYRLNLACSLKAINLFSLSSTSSCNHYYNYIALMSKMNEKHAILTVVILQAVIIHTVQAQSISGPVSIPTSTDLIPGTDVMFTVTVTGNTNPPSYFWQMNGAAISNGGKFSGANTATLTVSSVGEGEEGFYSCTVIADGTPLFSSSIELNVCKQT